MIRLIEVAILSAILLVGCCYRSQQKFITFNTSSTKYVISTSIATNLDQEFEVYCPVLINTKDSLAQFSMSEQKKKLVIEPRIVEDNELLYNDYNEGEYWYGFKKSNDPIKRDTTATFAMAKITVNNKTHDYFIPLFNLPLTFLSINNLYKCDDVLISYRRTDKLSDVTVFSSKESWKLEPEASWGFRNKDDGMFFSRQTYPRGTEIHVSVAEGKYCLVNEDIKENTYNLEEKEIYTLNDLLGKYTASLEVKDKNARQEVPQSEDL